MDQGLEFYCSQSDGRSGRWLAAREIAPSHEPSSGPSRGPLDRSWRRCAAWRSRGCAGHGSGAVRHPRPGARVTPPADDRARATSRLHLRGLRTRRDGRLSRPWPSRAMPRGSRPTSRPATSRTTGSAVPGRTSSACSTHSSRDGRARHRHLVLTLDVPRDRFVDGSTAWYAREQAARPSWSVLARARRDGSPPASDARRRRAQQEELLPWRNGRWTRAGTRNTSRQRGSRSSTPSPRRPPSTDGDLARRIYAAHDWLR